MKQIFVFVDGLFLGGATRSFAARRIEQDAIVSLEPRVRIETVVVARKLLRVLGVTSLAGESLALVNDTTNTRSFRIRRRRTASDNRAQHKHYGKQRTGKCTRTVLSRNAFVCRHGVSPILNCGSTCCANRLLVSDL